MITYKHHCASWGALWAYNDSQKRLETMVQERRWQLEGSTERTHHYAESKNNNKAILFQGKKKMDSSLSFGQPFPHLFAQGLWMHALVYDLVRKLLVWLLPLGKWTRKGTCLAGKSSCHGLMGTGRAWWLWCLTFVLWQLWSLSFSLEILC